MSRHPVLRSAAGAVCAALTAFAAYPASGAEFKVQVLQRGTDRPVAGAAACLGTPANERQFGVQLTGPDGTASFAEVPTSPLLLTVSGAGHHGFQVSLAAQTFDRLLVVSIADGRGGPRCAPPEETSALGAVTNLRVTALRVRNDAGAQGGRTVVLQPTVRGEPNQYRVSEHPDFAGAEWRPYEGAPHYALSPGEGRKMLYFQVRRYSEIDGASLQSLSNVATASINVQP